MIEILQILETLQQLPLILAALQQMNLQLQDLVLLNEKMLSFKNLEKENLLDAAGVKQLLKISDSTLFRYKKEGILIPRALNNRYYYLSDVFQFQVLKESRMQK